MGNCSTTLPKVSKCYNEYQEYYCKTCDRGLCARCKGKHIKDRNTQSHIIVCKTCSNEEKEYFCKTCKCSLCVKCKELHVKDLETKYHDVIRERVLCTHEDKEYYCNTCKSGLCEQCKERHDQNSAIKYHGRISKLINCIHKDKKYNCDTCQCSLCVLCKEKHVVDLDTKSHDIVIKQEPVERETCEIHPDNTCEMWCLSCKRPLCLCCLKQRKHEIMELQNAHNSFRQQCKDRIVCIRSDILPYNCALLVKMQSSVKIEKESQRTKLVSFQTEITNKTRRIKDQIDMTFMIKTESLSKLKSDLFFKLHQRQREMMRHISITQRFENKYEQSANRPAQFLSFLKKTAVPKMKGIPSSFTFSLGGTINNDDALKLFKIQITEVEKRKIGHEEMLEPISMPFFNKAIRVPIVYCVHHISLVTSDRFWISDGKDLILTDTAGHVLHHLRVIASYGHVLHHLKFIPSYGGHTLISDGDLVYIDSEYNIRKLSKQFTTSTLIAKTGPWRPRCIYCSPSTADFLVGMRRYDKNKHRYTAAKVARYDSAGEQIQSIRQNNIGKNLFSEPNYITENRNGDVIVSDWLHAVVVTDREGRLRFSYTGSTPQFRLKPCGICTDVLSNILICDLSTHTVQMIDKNGYFLSLLLTRQQGIRVPLSLNYDDENHLLWVGSHDNQTICVYRHIRRRIITDTESSYSSH